MEVDKKILVQLRNATFAGFADCRDALLATQNDFDAAVKWLKEKGKIKAAKKQGAIAADGVVMVYGKNDHCIALIEVNSQTDFVAKNENFLNCVNNLLNLILENKPEGIDALLALPYPGTNVSVNEELTQLTAKLGEKISVRRFAIMEAEGTDFVAGYTHANKRVAAIATFRGQNEPEVVKNVMMNIVANNPTAIDKNGVDKTWLDQEYKTLLDKTIAEKKPEAIAKKIAEGRLNKELEEICLVSEPLLTNQEVKVGQYLKDHHLEALKFIRYEVGEGIQKKQSDFAAEVAEQMNKFNGQK